MYLEEYLIPRLFNAMPRNVSENSKGTDNLRVLNDVLAIPTFMSQKVVVGFGWLNGNVKTQIRKLFPLFYLRNRNLHP